MGLTEIRKELRSVSSKEKADILQRFFKTGPGEYGEGDVFIGVKVPDIRAIARDSKALPFTKITELLRSSIHEESLLALMLLVLLFREAEAPGRKKIYSIYLDNTGHINTWDLVDLSARHIVGAYLQDKPRGALRTLALSDDLWERRIAVLSTFFFIKNNGFGDTLFLTKMLLHDKEDLLHKAGGWMLREIGKRDRAAEEAFLKKHYKTMPRTMLRYAIEKLPETKRQEYLKGTA